MNTFQRLHTRVATACIVLIAGFHSISYASDQTNAHESAIASELYYEIEKMDALLFDAVNIFALCLPPRSHRQVGVFDKAVDSVDRG